MLSALDRRILDIAVPSLFALALDPLLAAVDTALVGRLPGEHNLAALSVSASLFSLVFSSFNFFGNAATPVVAERAGRLGTGKACELAAYIVAIAAALGFCALLCLEAGAASFVLLMGVDANDSALHATALSFIRVRALSAPAVVTQTALNGSLRALGDARSGLVAAVGAGLVNLALDILFMFKLGWGVTGAAAATVVAEWCAVAFLGARALSARADAELERSGQAHETLRGAGVGAGGAGGKGCAAGGGDSSGAPAAEEPLLTALAPFFRGSAATVLRTLALQLFFACTTFTLGHSAPAPAAARPAAAARDASTALASHHVLLTVYVVLSFATDALAVAAQQIVASAQSAADKRAAASRVLQWGAVVGSASGVALGAGAPAIVAALAGSADVRSAATPVLRRLGAPLQPLSALVFSGDGILQGSLDFKFEALAMGAAAALGCAVLFAGDASAGGVAAAQTPAGPPRSLWLAWQAIAAVQLVRFLAFAWRCWASTGGPLASVTARPAAQGSGAGLRSDAPAKGLHHGCQTNGDDARRSAGAGADSAASKLF